MGTISFIVINDIEYHWPVVEIITPTDHLTNAFGFTLPYCAVCKLSVFKIMCFLTRS